MENISQEDKRRLLKAFHAFKTDPCVYNANRIRKAVKNASNTVYVENAVSEFANSLAGRPRYSSFSELLSISNKEE